MRPAIALTSDWHLQEGAWKSRGICGDALHSLRQVVDYCIRHSVPLLAAGDLFDASNPPPAVLAAYHREMGRMQQTRNKVYFTQGQHELHPTGGTWMGTHEWPTWVLPDLEYVETSAGGLIVQGFDWRPTSEVPQLLAAVNPAVDLIMLHQICEEFMGREVKGKPPELRLADVPGEAILLVGDYHCSLSIRAGGHEVYSPGSFAMQDTGEDPKKYFWVLDEAFRGHRVPLETRPVAHYEIPDVDALDRFLADAPWTELFGLVTAPVIATPLVTVTYPEGIPDVEGRLNEALADVHLFHKVVREQEWHDAVDSGGRVTSADLRSALDDRSAIDPEVAPTTPVYSLLSALIGAGSRDVKSAYEGRKALHYAGYRNG